MIKLFSLILTAVFISEAVFAFNLKQWTSFEDHRAQFNAAIDSLKNYNVEKMSLKSSADLVSKDLLTEAVILKKKKNRSGKVLVLSSGIHGVEAYVGSSIQIAFIEEYLQRNEVENGAYDFAFVHILNPWGMKNNRRVNVNNVDLNRNFLKKPQDFSAQNESYQKIDSFLNPSVELRLNSLHRFIFILDSIYYILQSSIDSLRRAILVGQYQNPRGLYFGGSNYDELKTSIDEFVDQKLQDYQAVHWIDLHTGYGARGKLHFLANEENDENAQWLKDFLPGRTIDFGQNQKFYKTSGDLISYLSSKFNSSQKAQTQKFTGLAFEYGTMNSQTTLGSIESLRRMVIENQSFHYPSTSENRNEVDQLILEMYNPNDNDWWNQISSQTQDVFDQIVK